MPVYNGLPSGTNKCIGAFSNETTGMLYTFIWNSEGEHTLNEYNSNTNTIFPVLQGSFLGFTEFNYINGVGMIDNQLLYWTDGINPPRSININLAKSGTYYVDSNSISLIKAPPQRIISAEYADDAITNTASNRLKDQLFQFRYLYVYEDNSRSAWSSCSALPLPQLEINSSVDTTPYKNNHIVLTFDAGSKYVKRIELAAQVKGVAPSGQTQDWFSILSVDRDDIINTINYQYNSSTNEAIYKFYNDGLYQSIDVLETDLPFDYVPLTSKALEIVNGNVLVLGNNKEGYDNIVTNVSFAVNYETNQVTRLFGDANYTGSPYYIQMGGVPYGNGVFVDSDSIALSYYGPSGGAAVLYVVSASASGSLYNALLEFGAQIQSDTSGGILFNGLIPGTLPGTYQMQLTLTTGYTLNPLTTLQVTLGNSIANSIPAYKTNSKYQFGLVYYDQFNRSSYVQTDDNFILSTNSSGETEGESPVISWIINHQAPTWAKKYQWVRTENLSHKTFLFWNASSVTASGSNIYELNLNSLITYDTTNPNSILAYDYTPGDRCTVHKQGSTWITGYDVAIVGFEVSGSNATLKIQNGGALTTGATNLLIEIYTPKTRSNSPQEQFFYEFGVQYDCSNGVHSQVSGTFTDGDVYTKTRTISGSGIYLEDPNFSDFYVSNYSSNGRTNIYAPQAKQLTLPTDIRFSDTYVPNTNVNGLSRFYGDAFEVYDRVNGSIQKLAIRDNYLLTFQELKTGYIPVLQSVIEDQGSGNAANVAISNKLLNKIRYFAGDYGIGLHPESFARFAGTVYFADPNRGIVLKLTSALQPISMIGMDSYFTKNLSDINKVPNAKILGTYDPRNDEYIITLKYSLDENSSTVAFSELINRWTTFYSFIPENGAYIFNKYFTFKDGNMFIHNVNDSYNTFYGEKYDSVVSLTYNQTPLAVKSFIGLMEQSTSEWIPKSTSEAYQSAETILASSEETGILTNLGQASNLAQEDFSYKEGVFFASLLRDVKSPGGLFNGDDLKGNWIKLRLVNDSPTKESLLSVEVRHIPSYQGIK